MSEDLLDAGRAAWGRLQAQWETTQEHWNDATTEHFARQYWEPLEDETAALERALVDLLDVMAEVRHTIQAF